MSKKYYIVQDWTWEEITGKFTASTEKEYTDNVEQIADSLFRVNREEEIKDCEDLNNMSTAEATAKVDKDYNDEKNKENYLAWYDMEVVEVYQDTYNRMNVADDVSNKEIREVRLSGSFDKYMDYYTPSNRIEQE